MGYRRSLAFLLVVAALHGNSRAGDADAPPPAETSALVADLDGTDLAKRRKAVYALWQRGAEAKDAVVPLARRLGDEDVYVRTTAAKALERHADLGAAVTVLAQILTRGADDVRLDAAKLLLRVGTADRPVAALEQALDDANPEVRANAAAGLEWTGDAGKRAVPALLRLVTEDEDARVRSWAGRALGSIDGDKLVAPMVEALASEDAAVRAEAAGILGAGGPAASGALRPLGRALADESPAVRAAAAAALGAIGPASEIDRLLAALDDPAPEVRAAALAAMNQPGSDGMEKALPRLVKLLDSEDAAVRVGAATALASMDPLPAISKLASMLRSDPEPNVRQAAAFGLSAAGLQFPDAEIPTLAKALDDPNGVIRQVAADQLRRLGRRAGATAPRVLQLAASEGEPFPRQAALRALPDLGVDAKTGVPVLVAALASETQMIRSAAAQALAEYGAEAAPATTALAERVTRDPDAYVQSASALTLGRIGPAANAAAAVLRSVPEDAPYLVRVHAACALASVSPEDAAKAVQTLVGLIGAEEWLGAVPITDLGLLGSAALPAEGTLLEILRKRDRSTSSAAALALCRIGGSGAEEALESLLAAASEEGPGLLGPAAALQALSELPQCADRSVPVIVRGLAAKDPAARMQAAMALAVLGRAAAAAIPDLERAAKDPASAVRRAAADALLRIR